VRASALDQRLSAAATKLAGVQILRQAMIDSWPGKAKNQIEEHSEVP